MVHKWNDGTLEYWNVGIMEYWSIGDGATPGHPSFQHSIIPLFQRKRAASLPAHDPNTNLIATAPCVRSDPQCTAPRVAGRPVRDTAKPARLNPPPDAVNGLGEDSLPFTAIRPPALAMPIRPYDTYSPRGDGHPQVREFLILWGRNPTFSDCRARGTKGSRSGARSMGVADAGPLVAARGA
jgi:hypothetical protein